MALCPAGALVAEDEGGVCAYAFALPWRADSLIGVAQVIDALPDAPDVLYIHDMVVAPDRRRTGVASTLFRELLRLARALDLARLTLVAVQGSEPFWATLGFEALERLEYAGVPATRMVRRTRPSR